jgi:hypothetical protein
MQSQAGVVIRLTNRDKVIRASRRFCLEAPAIFDPFRGAPLAILEHHENDAGRG